jgi:cytochrome c
METMKHLCNVLAAASVLAAAGLHSPAYAAGDAAAGEQIFEHTCNLCHQIGPGAKNYVGPELNGINGRKAGTADGYDYSAAMKNSGITWNEDTFKKYITNPQADIPGVKMLFAGLDKHSQRDNIWAYISQFKADGSK